MRYPAGEKLEIIHLVERSHLSVKRTLASLGVSRPTFCRWVGEVREWLPRERAEMHAYNYELRKISDVPLTCRFFTPQCTTPHSFKWFPKPLKCPPTSSVAWSRVVWGGQSIWCRGEDLNLHGVTPTST